jgi:hypothetical protein
VRYEATYPYDDCYYYKFYSDDGRCSISIFRNDGERVKVTAYARYLYETHNRKLLDDDVQVHHKDEDKTNDVIENLEELTFQQHKQRHKETDKRLIYVYLNCKVCGILYEVRTNDYKIKVKQGQKNWFCGRECQYKFIKPPVQKSELKHGTKSCYSYHRCRCEICKVANTERQRKYLTSKKSTT